MVAAQQQANTDRDMAGIEFFNDCMEGRGYTRGPKSWVLLGLAVVHAPIGA